MREVYCRGEVGKGEREPLSIPNTCNYFTTGGGRRGGGGWVGLGSAARLIREVAAVKLLLGVYATCS